jgi:heme oxygenase (biliverdin-IX-beta and delta-forming)
MAPSLLYHIAQMSTIADLRAATWPSHQKLERRLDVKARFSSALGYRRHLEQMWGFCAPLESRIEGYIGAAVPDFESRRKMPLLRRDLLVAGATPTTIDALPRAQPPPCEETADALGCLYVIEGATLGGRTLLPLVTKSLGLSAERGAEFLASYGDRVEAMWRGFGLALDAWCEDSRRSMRARNAAVATFESLSDWLRGDLR